jgi:hypothetical protein
MTTKIITEDKANGERTKRSSKNDDDEEEGKHVGR